MLFLWQISLLVVLVVGEDESKTRPEVKSPAGTFRGLVLTGHRGAQYASYRGIPFALPPIGDRRFALPEPFPNIENGVYDASNFGNICVQRIGDTSLGNEDCLYLNVYTPLNATASGVQLKKVLVFIHGGGFVAGDSNSYVPGDLVSQEDVIVVTPNYRLGWLGFLRGDGQSLPGNQGLWDQVLALKWVKNNIRAFGGDPDDITLSGESAGSISVSLLTISPVTSQLFTKAILMSGTAFMYTTPAQTSTDMLQPLSVALSCEEEADVVQCLKKQPAEKFHLKFSPALIAILPSSGDDLLPQPVPQLVNNTTYLNEVGFFNRSYIVSITKHDGYIRINSFFGKMDTTSLDSSILDLSRLLQFSEYVTESLLLEYLKLYPDLERAVIAICTDYFYLKRSNDFLEAFLRKRANHAPDTNAYFLSFDPVPEFMPRHYVVHAIDLLYLFDADARDLLESFYFIKLQGDMSDADFELKADYCRLISNFVKTGNPTEYLSQEKNVEWPPYDNTNKSYLSFSLEPSVHQDLLGARRAIWEVSVGQWQKEYDHLHLKEDL